MAKFTCPICSAKVEREDHAVETHIAEAHSDPDAREREIGGSKTNVTDAEYVRAFVKGAAVVQEDENEATTIEPLTTVFDDLGIKMDDLVSPITTTETGAAMTGNEAKKALQAVDQLAGFRVDRAQFLVDVVDWGIRNSFSEELQDAGGMELVQDPTVGTLRRFVRVTTIHSEVSDYLAAGGSGRTFTFRRFGRYLGPQIPKIVDKNPSLCAYFRTGSPVSNRLGVNPVLFLTVTSIYEYIKPFGKWTSDELSAWGAMNRSVTKVGNAGSREYYPQDLRPSPSQAETYVDRHVNDFGLRQTANTSDFAVNYGKGAKMLDDMLRSGQAGRTGVGYKS